MNGGARQAGADEADGVVEEEEDGEEVLEEEDRELHLGCGGRRKWVFGEDERRA